MPLPISDRKLASLYSTYQRQLQSQPNLKLGHEQVLKLLAEVGDTGASTSAKVLEQLQRPGLTREQQVALVQRGTTPEEKADLEAILDQGTVPLEPSAREFLAPS